MARELTWEQATKRTKKLKDRKKHIDKEFYWLGMDLRRAREDGVHDAMDYNNWSSFVEVELNTSDSLANDLIRIVELGEQFPKYRAMIDDVGVSNMRLILPHLKQDFGTREYQSKKEEVQHLLEDGKTMPWKALNHHLNDTPEQESKRYGPPPLSVTVPIPSNGEPHDYQVELNQRTGEVLNVVDLNPTQGKCIEVVTCKHCGAQNYAHIGYNHVVQVYAEPPEGEE